MFGVVYVLSLVVALSVDGALVGYAYGTRGITLSIGVRVLVSVISGFVMVSAVLLGAMTSSYLAPRVEKIAGGTILIAIGLITVLKGSRRHENSSRTTGGPPSSAFLRVLQDPEAADIDNSGSINSFESLLLGVALALDALGAGVGAGLTGLCLAILPFAVGLGMFAALSMGTIFGSLGSKWRLPKKGLFHPALPGILIMALGVASVMRAFPR
ncbi:MAG TPA: hypothetical protein GX507_04205 [Clostridia bacterium]|nr:hypothetical protein [Clostridia bacterium]